MDVKEFVLDYLQKEYTFPEDLDVMNLNYVESGYIDSLAFIQFIATIEDEFDIAFTDEDLDSITIKTVGGLIHMITQKTNPEDNKKKKF